MALEVRSPTSNGGDTVSIDKIIREELAERELELYVLRQQIEFARRRGLLAPAARGNAEEAPIVTICPNDYREADLLRLLRIMARNSYSVLAFVPMLS